MTRQDLVRLGPGDSVFLLFGRTDSDEHAIVRAYPPFGGAKWRREIIIKHGEGELSVVVSEGGREFVRFHTG